MNRSILPLVFITLVASCALFGGGAVDEAQASSVQVAADTTADQLTGLQEQLKEAQAAGTLTEAQAHAITEQIYALRGSLLNLEAAAKDADGGIGWTEFGLGLAAVFLGRGLPSKGPIRGGVNFLASALARKPKTTTAA